MTTKPSMIRDYRLYATVVVLLLCLVIQCILSMNIKSPTYDESVHLTGGYLALAQRDFSYGSDNPPLTRSLTALPLLFLDLTLPDKTGFTEHNKFLWGQFLFKYGKQFIFQARNNVDQIVFLSRLPIVGLSIILGLYIFLWSRKLYGDKAGLFALTLYVFSPNILAHSRLATLDLGVTCFMFISCYYFCKYLNELSFKYYYLAGLFFGLALVSKFSALILFPIFSLYLCVALYLRKLPSQEIHCLNNRKEFYKSLSVLFKHIFVLLLIISAVIFIAYGLRPDSLILFKQGLTTLWEVYLSKQYIADQPVYLFNYLLGEFYSEPKWFYPFIVFLVKTPVPIFILLVLSLGMNRQAGKNFSDELFLIIPIVGFFLISCLDASHQGLRRFLPIYPFIFIFVSKVVKFGEFHNVDFFKKSIILPTLTILMAWYLYSSIKTFPDYLTYFNDLTAGPKSGINILDNTNLDWGQDLKRLKPFMESQGIRKIKLIYHGTADPNYYRINTEPLTVNDFRLGPRSGYYAISANVLIRITKKPELFGLAPVWGKTNFDPIEIIGNTIYIFKFG